MSINEILAEKGMTKYRLSVSSGVPREKSYEYGLPDYLQHDLDAYKKGLCEKSSLIDCLWGELYGSINMAEINDGAITPEHADYLRKKFPPVRLIYRLKDGSCGMLFPIAVYRKGIPYNFLCTGNKLKTA